MASWMMLDRFVYRRDDDGFPDESTAPLRATSSTSLGQDFDVAFLPAEPPAISRLYVRWPGGTTPEDGKGTDLATAHRDLLLLRLTSIQVLDERPYRRYLQDHFICVASSDPGGPRLQIKRLPVCTIPMVVSYPPRLKWRSSDGAHHDTEATVMTEQKERTFFPNSLGLVRARSPTKYGHVHEDEFAVAQLATINHINGTCMMEAEVCVLRSRVSAGDDDGSWEVKKIPIQHKIYEYNQLYQWSANLALAFKAADAVVTFNQCVCWVDYVIGGILFYEVFEEETPKISYLPLSTDCLPTKIRYPQFLDMNRSLCITSTSGGDVLRYFSAIRSDGELRGPIPPEHVYFYVVSLTLRTRETGEMMWAREKLVTCSELWAPNTSPSVPPLRGNSLMFPLVSMDDPKIVHFMLSEQLSEEGDRKIPKVSVVTIDLPTKKVISMVPYIKGDQDLHGEDADMVKDKSHLLTAFLPSEFPKFFNLKRDHTGHI